MTVIYKTPFRANFLLLSPIEKVYIMTVIDRHSDGLPFLNADDPDRFSSRIFLVFLYSYPIMPIRRSRQRMAYFSFSTGLFFIDTRLCFSAILASIVINVVYASEWSSSTWWNHGKDISPLSVSVTAIRQNAMRRLKISKLLTESAVEKIQMFSLQRAGTKKIPRLSG